MCGCFFPPINLHFSVGGVFQPAIFDDTRLEVGLHHEFWGLFDMNRGDGSVSKRTTIGYYTHIYIYHISSFMFPLWLNWRITMYEHIIKSQKKTSIP